MANWKSRSDDQIWWESQPSNRGKTYPGDDISSKQYERNKAAGENNLSIARNFFEKLTGKKKSEAPVDLGPPEKSLSEYPVSETGSVSLKAKGGKISLKNCKVSTHAKNKNQSNW
jgi:hypothetical protein